MTDLVADQHPPVYEGEVRNFAVSFADCLDDGEKLTGTPTVEEQSTSDLTISSIKRNSAAITVNEVSVAANEAVQFRASGFLAATGEYTLLITITTDANPAQTIKRKIKFPCQTE